MQEFGGNWLLIALIKMEMSLQSAISAKYSNGACRFAKEAQIRVKLLRPVSVHAARLGVTDAALHVRVVLQRRKGGYPRNASRRREMRNSSYSGSVRSCASSGSLSSIGRATVPALISSAAFDERRGQGVGFVLDLTERKRAEAETRESERRYREALMEVAHDNRVTTMGQLTASIAHEINQPIAAVVSNAQAWLNWLNAQPPELEQVRQTLRWIISDGTRAADVIGRIRALIRNAPTQKEPLAINDAVLEVIALTSAEAVKNGVSVQTQFARDLPLIRTDRVQIQQVILNSIMNAVEAMSGVSEGTRELLISTGRYSSNGVLVSLRDSGPGLDPKSLDRLFDPFYTTKALGMGMGLAICRSIIQAHGGRMWAGTNEPQGAVFQFTVPPEPDEIASAEHAARTPVA
ncbi:ATP-binding protein [Bradyrhizobium sp. WSM2793]|uniref:sensor histidine kinase n=1 Tax=Bradyrhizobium sp. WSM2793 TaxID=1038866 RepID=UPI000A063D3D